MEYLAFINSPWFQMLAPVVSAFLTYRFPDQVNQIVGFISGILGWLKAPKAKR